MCKDREAATLMAAVSFGGRGQRAALPPPAPTADDAAAAARGTKTALAQSQSALTRLTHAPQTRV